MKVALAQINPTIGDFNGTVEKMVRTAINARAEGAGLTIFGELSLTGYPPRDLLEKQSFLDAQDRALDRLKKALKGLPAIVGCVTRRFDGVGNLLYNSCAMIVDGDVLAVGRKCLLPTYDVFDEARYFEAAEKPTVVEFRGLRWGLTICEDVWNDKDFWQHRMYAKDPVEDVVNLGADIIVNLSASPYCMGKQSVKEAMLSSLCRKYRRQMLYVNQVGGNDELLFDGRSMAFNEQGKLIARGHAFDEGVTIVDIENSYGQVSPRLPEEEELRKALVMGMRDYGNKCGFEGGVIGLSGGIDSALTASLAAEAFGSDNVIGVAMPSRYSSADSMTDARDLAERLGIEFHIVPIEKPFSTLKEILAPVFAGRPEDTTEENLQARIRGVVLMALSNKFGHLLLTTGNKSEIATGYCTLYGDMCGGLAAISDLYKTTVYQLSKHLNTKTDLRPPIPTHSITREPSAELRPDQKDSDALPPYETLDGILKAYIEDRKSMEQIVALGFEFETVKRVLRLVDFNEYKRRQAAPGLKVSSKAFGMGRRIPIAHRFREAE
ncbi:MAG: NAD+ synthase [Planctomycetota bacterium]|nr:NAD+ synthase [Planctomycetota bacterium]